MNCLNACGNPGNQCPPDGSRLNYFAEIVINDNLIIPPEKPPVEHISAVVKDFKIEDVEVLDVNLGGTPPFLGRKVVIAGTLTLGVEYSAAVPAQHVHFAHYNIPFKALITFRPCTTANRGLLPAGFDIADYDIRICVEHEQYHIVNPREIRKCLVVLIWLEPKTPTP